MSAKIVSSRVKRANDVENIKHYLVSKYLLFFIMICSFYPGNCKSPICVRFVNLFAKASRVCDCKYSKGKRGSEEKHENWRSKSRREAWRFLLGTHTYSKPLLVLCIRLLLHHWRKLSKIMQIQTFLLHSISVFSAASSGRDFCPLSRFSQLGIDFIALKVFSWTVQDLIRGA